MAEMRNVLVAVILLILVGGCARSRDEVRVTKEPATAVAASVSDTPTVTHSFTPEPTATHSASSGLSQGSGQAGTATVPATPTFTPTATATPTPTATAVPITTNGNPRAVGLRPPAAEEGAPCGLVDLLDFPLDAPHAADAQGGGDDFAIFRNRFDGYHTGEDWWHSGGRHSSLGAPVYSIGHGQVTYAEPLGWGRDKGIVIVRHNFADGPEHQPPVALSFYGHLDEDSLEVEAGDCVARGDLVGKIGRPTTGPHLHFELRTVMPYAPGRGYLPDDPTLAGYLPPSNTIWNSRMAVSPGVLWTLSAAREGAALLPRTRGVETAGGEIAVVLGEEYLAGIDTADGSERWRMAVSEDVEAALLDTDKEQIYTADQFGEVSAYALPDPETAAEESAAQPLWTVDADAVGIPVLMPLPDGGLVLSAWDHLIAISAAGELLWEAELETRPLDWLVSGDRLFITAAGGERPLWTADADGPQNWDVDTAGGRLAANGDNVLLYDGNALYQLDLAVGAVREPPLLALPGGRVETGAVAALLPGTALLPGEVVSYDAPPVGGAVLAHVDRHDRRLIALDGSGNVLWERSIGELSTGTLELIVDGEDIFLAAENPGGSGVEIALYALDVGDASLKHLFTGGTRSSAVDQTRILPLGNGRMLISIDGRSLTVIDTREAERAVNSVQ